MLRIFTGVCHCQLSSVHFPMPLFSLLRLGLACTLGIGACSGCGFDKSALASGTDAKAVAADPPAMARLQNADPELKKDAGRSILDLVSYETTGANGHEVRALIRATVNGVPILDHEVRLPIMPQLYAATALPEPERSTRRSEMLKQELDALIDRELIYQDFSARVKDKPQIMEKLKEAAQKDFEKKMREERKRLGVKDDDEFKAILRARGWSLEALRRHLNREFVAHEYMANLIVSRLDRIGHEQIQEYYDNHPEEFRVLDNVTWQDIFIDAARFPNRDAAQQFAVQLIAKARNGEDFVQLVKQYDQGDSSYRNGEGFGHRRGEIKPPDAEPVLFQMRDGEIGPILEQTNGFHVIRLVKREYAGLKPFDTKIQSAILNKLKGIMFEKEYKRIVATLRSQASIQISAAAP
jgi:peptidyl-prolyl cis-trans isomerase SurA